MDQPIHILNQMGVLTSFSVAKRITEEEIHKHFTKQKKAGKSENQIGEMLRDRILTEIQEAVQNNKIPGLLTPQEFAQNMGISKPVAEKIPELNRLLMVIIHKMSEKKYDKMALCYFINSLVNMLGLTKEDFMKFHNQNNINNDGDDDDDDEFKDA
jgi:ribosomal protein S25